MACNIRTSRGISLIEALIVASLVSLFFGGLFSGLVYSLELVRTSKAKLSALSVATDQVEYIRSLAYDSVGTIAGIPPGAIPQVSTTTLNNIDFTVRTLVSYIDDDADGLGVSDSNSITTDYKQAKVIVSWIQNETLQEVFLITNVIPRSIETDVGGGTLRVNVFDANVNPLPGVQVQLINATMTPAINVTRTTDSAGSVLFGGAPAGSEYEIYVSGTGYSSDQTYRATTSLPFPNVQPVSVVEADISTVNFFIDELSAVDITTYDTLVATSTIQVWDSMSDFATSTGLAVVSNEIVLEQSAGIYVASGTALTFLSPSSVDRWETVTSNTVVSGNATATLYFYTGTSTPFVLISDTDLPGNATGFTGATIDISSLDADSYPYLILQTKLETASATNTPVIRDVTVDYVAQEIPRSGVAVTLVGAKTIGTNSSAAPVYKNTYTATTDGTGRSTISDVEWDGYVVTVSGLDIVEACPANPLSVDPGTTQPLDIIVAANTAHSLRVVTETTAGVPVPGATVTLSRSGYTETQTSSACGQVYFGGLTSASDYTVTADAGSYSTHTTSDYSVSGDATYVVQW